LYEVSKFRGKKNLLPPTPRKILNLLPGRGKQEGPEKISDPFTDNKASHP